MALILFSLDIVDCKGPGGDGAASSVVVLRMAVEVDVPFHVEIPVTSWVSVSHDYWGPLWSGWWTIVLRFPIFVHIGSVNSIF